MSAKASNPNQRGPGFRDGAKGQQPKGMVDEVTAARILQYQDDLLGAQTELGSLRNQIQPWESITPAQAIDDFRQINKRIKEVCRTISESILDQEFADVTDPTTSHMTKASLERFTKAIGGCDRIPSLVASPTGDGRPLEDVFEYGLRSIINQYLCTLIFEPFHHSLPWRKDLVNVSERLWHTYDQMRKQKTQLISGMWRANTFHSLDRGEGPWEIKTLAPYFCNLLSANLKILKGHDDSGHDFDLSDDDRQELEEIFRFAYNWNKRVKSGAIFTDFHPICLPNDEEFDSATMLPYDDVEKPKGSSRILCAVTLGLQSSEAPKEGQEPLYIWQEKVRVLTGEYFDDPEVP